MTGPADNWHATGSRAAGWRHWRIVLWGAGELYRLGLVSGFGLTGDSRGWYLMPGTLHWFGKPVYVLHVRAWWWRCLPLCLRGGHLPYGPVGAGICGKCAPWPCCGAYTFDHAEGCDGD